ncbi:hypothetical protein GUITHDRAFT_114714 [Guillardia theta CCMP2712]|uniref:Uncharacterized protein n=1 Tax=Guillardia theta (strain CCMP2712) TaxID=905079 RepID=L1IST3_GUITC|nr:hypothetical protein GUITHDRAFT_114714 [Guillardia theta CCMP2712]EKX39278.1 hypothetical protein GUITHDRAFT_114714 [Guillardia theta CCMP2712]|eukprot:XP_005826258.1 hypothetical protein GUITHDRAFT_114714 [Guillardia theta CCMP2712]
MGAGSSTKKKPFSNLDQARPAKPTAGDNLSAIKDGASIERDKKGKQVSESDEEQASDEEVLSTQDEGNTKHVQFSDEEYLNSNKFVTDLFFAAQEGNVDEFKKNMQAQIPLHLAILISDVNAVRLLLQQRAIEQLSAVDSNGLDAMLLAMKKAKLNMVKLLHEEYEVQLKREAGRKTSMHMVAESGDLPTAEYLLDGISNDADKIKFLNRKDKEGNTALHILAKSMTIGSTRSTIFFSFFLLTPTQRPAIVALLQARKPLDSSRLDAVMVFGEDESLVSKPNDALLREIHKELCDAIKVAEGTFSMKEIVRESSGLDVYFTIFPESSSWRTSKELWGMSAMQENELR